MHLNDPRCVGGHAHLKWPGPKYYMNSTWTWSPLAAGLHQVLHVPMTWPPPVTCKANALFNVQIRWNNLCNLFYCYSLFINFYCLDKTHWQKIRRRMFSSWALIPDQWKPLWFDHFVFDYKKPDMGLIQNLICDYFLFTFIIWLHVGFIFFWWQFKLCWKDAK